MPRCAEIIKGDVWIFTVAFESSLRMYVSDSELRHWSFFPSLLYLPKFITGLFFHVSLYSERELVNGEQLWRLGCGAAVTRRALSWERNGLWPAPTQIHFSPPFVCELLGAKEERAHGRVQRAQFNLRCQLLALSTSLRFINLCTKSTTEDCNQKNA